MSIQNYFDRTSKEFLTAERNIDQHTNAFLNFFRKYTLQQWYLTQEEIDMFINSILSDPICKNEITGWYEMKDIENEKGIPGMNDIFDKLKPSYRLDKKTNNEEIRKIENIRKRFLQQKQEKSYKKHPEYKNKPEYEERYKSAIHNFDTRDITLNQIIEFSIRNLLEDILQELKGKYNIRNIEVIKTNEYDDVSAKTDYIIKIEYPWKESYQAFDLTISGNTINTEKKRKPESVFCPNFHFNEHINFAIPRSLIVIEDKEFIFKYLKGYMQQIQNTGKIEPNQALEIREKTGDKNKIIKENIMKQIIKNISLN